MSTFPSSFFQPQEWFLSSPCQSLVINLTNSHIFSSPIFMSSCSTSSVPLFLSTSREVPSCHRPHSSRPLPPAYTSTWFSGKAFTTLHISRVFALASLHTSVRISFVYRPLGFPTFPSLLLHFSPFLLSPPLLSLFSFCLLFSLFPFFPSSTVSMKFPSPPLIFCFFQRFFGQSDASPRDSFVSNVPHEAPPTHRTRHVVKQDFAMFLGIFRHIQKKGPNQTKAKKKEGLNFHVIRTLSFFRRKVMCHERNLTMMSTNGSPRSSRIRSEGCSPNDHPKCQEHRTRPLLLHPSSSLSLPFLLFPLFMNT